MERYDEKPTSPTLSEMGYESSSPKFSNVLMEVSNKDTINEHLKRMLQDLQNLQKT